MEKQKSMTTCFVTILSIQEIKAYQKVLSNLYDNLDYDLFAIYVIDKTEEIPEQISIEGWQIRDIRDCFGEDFSNQAFIFNQEEFLTVCRIRCMQELLKSFGVVISVLPPYLEKIGIPPSYEIIPNTIYLSLKESHSELVASLNKKAVAINSLIVICNGDVIKTYINWCVEKIDFVLRASNASDIAFTQSPEIENQWHFIINWYEYATMFPLRLDFTAQDSYITCKCKEDNLESVQYPYDCFPSGIPIPIWLRRNYVRNYRLRRLCENDPFKHQDLLLNKSDVVCDKNQFPITPVMKEIVESRPDLAPLIISINNEDRLPFVKWFLENRYTDSDLRDISEEYFSAAKIAYDNYIETAANNSANRFNRIAKKINSKKNAIQKNNFLYPEGVNLCGFINGQFGLGEATRIVADILDAGKIPFTIIEYEVPIHNFADEKWAKKISNEFIYNTNIILTNIDGLPSFLSGVDKSVFQDRYNIAYWFWELLTIPEKYLPSFDLVDEIWISSRFFVDTYKKYTDKPVIVIPLSISMKGENSYTRKDFGLPEKDFIFLTSYDSLSVSERKNPMAVVNAFRSAFKNEEKVRLVIKINAPLKRNSDIELLSIIKESTNIDVLIGTYSKEKMNALINICDAFISLHRSEGFGLAPAEAMYLGKPVILTNWSGNTEYMTDDNCCPVNFKLIEIQETVFPYDKGNIWADADVEDAAKYMARLYQDQEYYIAISENAKDWIRNYFTPGVISKTLKKRLVDLNLFND